jgi:hypothetical protein
MLEDRENERSCHPVGCPEWADRVCVATIDEFSESGTAARSAVGELCRGLCTTRAERIQPKFLGHWQESAVRVDRSKTLTLMGHLPAYPTRWVRIRLGFLAGAL